MGALEHLAEASRLLSTGLDTQRREIFLHQKSDPSSGPERRSVSFLTQSTFERQHLDFSVLS